MKHLIAVLGSLALTLATVFPAHAAVMDNEIDPENLGTGQWIYFLEHATNRLGGNVESVTDVPSLMKFYKNSGIDFVVVKSGTGAKVFPEDNPQFTRELLDAAHAAGLKIFGYTRSNGKDVKGEIALAIQNYDIGADGFVIDAEAEWESNRLENGPEKAIRLCKGIKARYPNKFLGHAPFPIISYHSSFPYKEFGLYCDAVMPQAYWKSIGVSPTRMVEWMNDEWHAWHRSLPTEFKGAIKPLAPIGQGWSPDADRTMKANEILEFVAALNHHPNPASPTGYKGVSYWRTDLHTGGMWRSIRKAKIAQLDTTPKEWVRHEKNRTTAKSDVSEPGAANAPIEVVVPPPAENANDFVLDNNHPDVSIVGKWYPGKGQQRLYGDDYLCANTVPQGKPTATAVYRPLIRNAGHYDVFIWYVPHANRSRKSSWFISYAGGSEFVSVDQSTGGGEWHRICEAKPFDPGTDGFVTISNDTGEPDKVVVADAVRFVRRDDIPNRSEDD